MTVYSWISPGNEFWILVLLSSGAETIEDNTRHLQGPFLGTLTNVLTFFLLRITVSMTFAADWSQRPVSGKPPLAGRCAGSGTLPPSPSALLPLFPITLLVYVADALRNVYVADAKFLLSETVLSCLALLFTIELSPRQEARNALNLSYKTLDF